MGSKGFERGREGAGVTVQMWKAVREQRENGEWKGWGRGWEVRSEGSYGK